MSTCPFVVLVILLAAIPPCCFSPPSYSQRQGTPFGHFVRIHSQLICLSCSPIRPSLGQTLSLTRCTHHGILCCCVTPVLIDFCSSLLRCRVRVQCFLFIWWITGWDPPGRGAQTLAGQHTCRYTHIQPHRGEGEME